MSKFFSVALVAASTFLSLSCVSGCGSSSGTMVLEDDVPQDPSLNDSFYGDQEAVYSDNLNDSGE